MPARSFPCLEGLSSVISAGVWFDVIGSFEWAYLAYDKISPLQKAF
jgi:hypothetical protein